MEAQAILTKIEQDAKTAAQKVQTDAETKARTMKLDAQANREMMEKTMLAQAEQECVQMEERMQRMADLDNRKDMLARKRQVIDDVFEKAREKLAKTTSADRRAFYLRQIVKYAGGEETLIAGADGADWFDDGFAADVNKALKAAGKADKIKLHKEHRVHCAGVVLSFKGAEIHITFDSLLDEARAELEQATAQALFTD